MSAEESHQPNRRNFLSRARLAVHAHLDPRIYWMARRPVAALSVPWIWSIRSGHFRSAMTGKIVDKRGEALPWYCYPAIDFFDNIDFAGRTVLEFGAGYSTRWWAKRARQVTSYEANTTWLSTLAPELPANVELLPFPTDDRGFGVDINENLARDLRNRKFDVIVIDGADRAGCAIASLKYLSEDGIIIFDNSDTFTDEHGVNTIINLYREEGFLRIDFTGLAPANLFPHSTSLIFRASSFAVQGTQNPGWDKPFERESYLNSRLPGVDFDIRS